MKMFIVKSIEKVISAAAVIMLFTSCVSRPDAALFTDPNNYSGSDIERINAALRDAQKYGGICRISRRRPDAVSNREYWLIDSAISVPGNTTLYINNCKIKLSDLSRDNWIRSANCQPGKSSVELLTDIHIIGEGSAVLEGADHPRSTGDSGKILENIIL
ncbi:MAG: hypothetical protein E7044_04150 [Lentisphaerae bacterium]|nr:hypothetical protein [Lentisphaerota bacterium]